MLKERKQRRASIKVGDTLGCWKVVEKDQTVFRVGKRPRQFWRARCSYCGTERRMSNNHLLEYDCGAVNKCARCLLRPKGEGGLERLLFRYTENARHNDRCFELTMGEFKEITSSPCHYCGVEPQQQIGTANKKNSSDWSIYLYNGIDRKDNSKEYISGNCLPCCGVCNRAKGKMTYEEFIEYINRFKHLKYAFDQVN